MSQIVFLADYFAVIDSDDSSNNDSSKNDSSEHRSQTQIQPKVKFRIPEKNSHFSFYCTLFSVMCLCEVAYINNT